MSKREQYLKAYRNEPFERLTWAPNFDYWLDINTRRGTVPEPYRGMSRNDIVRAVGGAIWARTSTVSVSHPGIEFEKRDLSADSWRTIIHTPSGDLTTLHVRQGGFDRSTVLHEHAVKGVDDLPALAALLRSCRHEVHPERSREQLQAVGEDGILIDCGTCVPFIEFCKMDAGWEQGLYLWYDHRRQVDELLELYEQVYLEQVRLLAAHSAAGFIHLGDNMDQLMVSPDLFRRYALPYYAKVARIVHDAGKRLSVHWCGRTGKLLPLLPGSGVDIVEAVVTEPMSDLTVAQALESLRGEVVLQGCLPAVLMCPQGGSRADLERYVRHIVDELRPKSSFVLGMGDNVPPDADFERVPLVSELVARAYA